MVTSSESEVQPLQIAAPVQNDEEIQQTYRALLAWMDDPQAVQVRASFLTDTLENHLQAIAAANPSSVKSGSKPGISSRFTKVTKKLNALLGLFLATCLY